VVDARAAIRSASPKRLRATSAGPAPALADARFSAPSPAMIVPSTTPRSSTRSRTPPTPSSSCPLLTAAAYFRNSSSRVDLNRSAGRIKSRGHRIAEVSSRPKNGVFGPELHPTGRPGARSDHCQVQHLVQQLSRRSLVAGRKERCAFCLAGRAPIAVAGGVDSQRDVDPVSDSVRQRRVRTTAGKRTARIVAGELGVVVRVAIKSPPTWSGADGRDRAGSCELSRSRQPLSPRPRDGFALPVSAVGSGDHRGSEAVSCVRWLLWSGPAPLFGAVVSIVPYPTIVSPLAIRLTIDNDGQAAKRQRSGNCAAVRIPEATGTGRRSGVWSVPGGQLGRRGQRRGVCSGLSGDDGALLRSVGSDGSTAVGGMSCWVLGVWSLSCR
jgi:hypothetical protein